jgi:hypothetical protein
MTPDEMIEQIQKMCTGVVTHVLITDEKDEKYWPVQLSFSRIGVKRRAAVRVRQRLAHGAGHLA